MWRRSIRFIIDRRMLSMSIADKACHLELWDQKYCSHLGIENIHNIDLACFWRSNTDRSFENIEVISIIRWVHSQTFIGKWSGAIDGSRAIHQFVEPFAKYLLSRRIGYRRQSIARDGLVNLVRNFPELEQLSLHPLFSGDHLKLKKSTNLRIYEICLVRNKKIVFYNFDASIYEPFEEGDQQQYFQWLPQMRMTWLWCPDLNGFDKGPTFHLIYILESWEL